MYRLMLVVGFVLMLVLLVNTAVYFYTLGFLHNGPWPTHMMLSYYIPNLTVGVTLGIGALAVPYVIKTYNIDDRVADNPIVLIILAILYILAIIAMVIITRWASFTIYGH